MTLIDQGKVIIEVATNESVMKAANSNIPYGPEDVAADAILCARAGAAIVHFHARDSDGVEAKNNDEIYRLAMEGIARVSDMLVFPTAFRLPGDPWRREQVPHYWALLDNPPSGARLELASVSPFHIGPGPAPIWDAASRQLMTRGAAPLAAYKAPEIIAELLDRRVIPIVSCSDLGDVRWLRLAALSGLVPQPVRMQLHLYDRLLIGASAIPATIDAVLAEWGADGPIDAEIEVVLTMDSREELELLLNHSLERGLNIRVGLGDAVRAFSTTWTNADVVSWAVELSARHGLQPASPSEVRARFGLPSPIGPRVSVDREMR